MFPIDEAKLPSLKTRRGLMVVDPQNDFLAKDGALPVKTPEDLPQRIVELVTAFRQCGGEIIWVQSQFGAPRSAQSEQILTSDGPMLTGSSKGRRPRTPQQGIEVSKCPEAFLGPEASTRPRCVRQGSSGIEMHPAVQQAVQPKDHVVVKSYYSAFKSEQLLRLLRRRLVTELFICGSLTNIGVMATAIDAASHGYCIAIVEDCCGYRSSMRHHNAIQSISDATGCDVLTREGTLEVFQPKSRFSRRSSQRSSTADEKSSTLMNLSRRPMQKDPSRGYDPCDAMSTDLNLKESEPLCEGDTKVIYDVLPHPLADNIFEKIRDEVRWQRMSHQGGEVPRLVAVQGQVDHEGNMPIYRHPADESPPLFPFSPTVLEIKNVIEDKLGHPLNHVLIQFYRDGNDYISEHSDKTLDIAKDSFIANVSLGAERTMVLRTKRQPKGKSVAESEPAADELKRQVQRARLPHNSLCKMGLVTNMRWLHGIRQDKRLQREKSAEELAYDGGRISLTFRRIATFLDRDSRLIWGQGAAGKTKAEAHEVINGQTPDAVRMLQAFGRENQSTDFDWDEFYGAGFDVLHISASPRLFLSPDPVVNMRIQLMLTEFGVGYARGSMSPTQHGSKDGKPDRDPAAIPPEDLPVKFVDNDPGKTLVQGGVAIMLYLDRVYGKKDATDDSKNAPPSSQPELARQFTRFQQALSLLDRYGAGSDEGALGRELAVWTAYAAEAEFIAGPSLTLADFAFWPILHSLVAGKKRGVDIDGALLEYYERVKGREAVQKVLATSASTGSS
ncbi:hypothetical protein DL770_000254 [Monosporascus sp. CRB-9-2]|nr:hypothetical protein DL770_000254 [Monosporascus sp. CRB-9-2]